MNFVKSLLAKPLLKSRTPPPWLWAFIGAFSVWLATIAFTGGQGATQIIIAALSFAAFSTIVGMGQMFVITLGPGNIDLSIPATLTLAGVVSMKLMDSQEATILLGLTAALTSGILVGSLNFGLIKILKIPPIIATMSSSFLILSTAISYGRGIKVKPPTALAEFAIDKIAGIPIIAILVIILAVIMALILHLTIFGKSIRAIGQNPKAANLAGINVDMMRYGTYVLCAVLASFCGFLLAGFSGGASLNMGNEYLLVSIAVVVIGGSSVSGGISNVTGVWGAAIFLFLLVTMLNTFGLSAGVRLILTGVIIVTVIIFSTNKSSIKN